MQFPKQIIVLVGLMGAGKSRTGPELAKLMKLPFIDSDDEIERISNATISEIFKKYGEKEFRLREQQIMTRLLTGEPKIIASGGGAFIQPEIRPLIKEKAISVWLKANFDVLVERISYSKHRPALFGQRPAEILRNLMEVREPVYAEADITIVTDDQTPQNAAQSIKAEVDRLVSGK